jgi:arsenite methyltransferase
MAIKQLDVESAVKRRYSAGARTREQNLCCASINYRADLLKVLPREILERDYGCGDPSRHVREGETVLDLGSGAGKICYIAAQVVGANGRVIGVDFNDDMLALARKYQTQIGNKLGFHNVEFRKGKIQYVSRVVRKDSVDVVVSNCVLNLVRHTDKPQLFREIYRVLKRGGRAVISDITSDEDVPVTMQNDPDLWSGCISGALREDLFLKAFEDAGFYGIEILERQERPWRVVRGIEFRSVTVAAYKGKEGPCIERNQAVIYKGPFREVLDDDGHRLRRGERVAVCDKTFQIYSREPYRQHFVFVPPRKPVALAKAKPFDCSRTALRHPRETKGLKYKVTTRNGSNGNGCGPGCC